MPEKDDISEAIKTRVIERLENGATNEVKKLLQKNPDTKLPVYTSLGVSQILSFLQSKISLEELKDIWARAEIDYARRQIVWFKKQVGIIWYDKGTNRKALAKELAKKLINKNDKEKTR
jgi:tRNA A37 N6-isopentenylltransferase MiaA